LLTSVDNDKIETEGIDIPYTKKLITEIHNEALMLGQEA